MKKYLVCLALGLLVSSVASASKLPVIPEILDATALKAVEPCGDFYQFACGSWIDRTVIPSDRSSIYHQSSGLSDKTDLVLHDILFAYSKGDFRVKATYAKLLGDQYASCMSRSATAEKSKAILDAELAEIGGVADSAAFAERLAALHIMGSGGLFGFASGVDPNDSKRMIAIAAAGGMSLPDKDYYLKTDTKSLEVIAKFETYVADLFVLNGMARPAATQASSTIFEIEKFLATKALPLDERYDPAKTNHPIKRTDFVALAPAFDWNAYFGALGLKDVTELNVSEPDFYRNLSDVFSKWKLEDLKTYLKWNLLNRAAMSASPESEALAFGFWNRYLNGQKVPRAKSKDCTDRIESSLGYALAEAYVSKIESAAIKKRVEAMILQIKAAFAADLDRLSHGEGAWMDEATAKAAVEKLSLLGQKVGAPDRWRNYDSLKIDRGSYLGNNLRISEFESKRDLAKIGKTVDRTEWYMMPWEINAYYDPSLNEFVFPFGILQPPSFDLKASDGANLGAFGGGTIGHELTHGWDDDGRKYDGYGNVKDWWSAETKKHFEEKTTCFVKQADAYPIVVEGKSFNVNGSAIVTENLADQGGVKLGYDALATILRSRAPAKPWLGKYTEAQTYWIAYAQSWCAKRTPESMRSLITTNPHPPEEFRVNGVLMNRPEFAKDFGCKAGDRMVSAERCSIW